MPAKNTIKTFIKDGYYHIYNRGVEKRTIFEDAQDYKVFLKYLKEYLSPPLDIKDLKTIVTIKGTSFKGVPRQVKNYNKKIELIAYCLMPNHFHLLINQKDTRVMENFMRSFLTRYSMFFNQKYNRVGPLFQGIYKAVLIKDDVYLLHLSRYIHLNPSEHTKDLLNSYSSYSDFLGLKKTEWINPSVILSFFDNSTIPELVKVNSYRDFVENYKKDSANFLGKLTLE
jgi:putative transposase